MASPENEAVPFIVSVKESRACGLTLVQHHWLHEFCAQELSLDMIVIQHARTVIGFLEVVSKRLKPLFVATLYLNNALACLG